MNRIKKVAAVMLCLAGVLSSCSAGHTAIHTASGSHSGGVVVALAAAPASLDFTTTSGAAIPQAMMANIYEGLVRINQQGEIEPLLANDWTISEDGKNYRFNLRRGVTFSNGSPFNAQAAKFSIERVQSDAWTNGLKAQMDPVESVTAVDDYILEVTLKERSNNWLWNMGTFVGAMFSPDGVDNLAVNPIGTGPYVLDKWNVGQSLEFVAREDYWGEAPKNNRAALRYFGDAVAATNALQSGDVDVVYSMQSPELLETINARGEYSVEVGTTNGEVVLSMNPRRAPFDNPNVRKAVMYAINRQDVINTAWDSYGTDTGAVPASPADPWYFVSDQYPYDPDKARELLADVDKPIPVTISVPSLPYAQAASEMVVSQLRDVGFDVKIESTEFPAVWLAKVYKGHDFDMSIISHVEARDIPNMFGNPDYYIGFGSDEIQQLLSEADTGPKDQQDATMRKAIQTILDDAAADTLFNLPNIVVSDPAISGVPVNSVTQALPLAPISREGGKD